MKGGAGDFVHYPARVTLRSSFTVRRARLPGT